MDENNQTVERVVEVDRGSGGWMVSVIILIIVIAGIFVWMNYGAAPAAEEGAGLDINVTVPAGSGEPAGPAE